MFVYNFAVASVDFRNGLMTALLYVWKYNHLPSAIKLLKIYESRHFFVVVDQPVFEAVCFQMPYNVGFLPVAPLLTWINFNPSKDK